MRKHWLLAVFTMVALCLNVVNARPALSQGGGKRDGGEVGDDDDRQAGELRKKKGDDEYGELEALGGKQRNAEGKDRFRKGGGKQQHGNIVKY